jgi:hypothetical protein
MNTKGYSSSNQHGRLSPMIVSAQPRLIELAGASCARVRQSRGCHRFWGIVPALNPHVPSLQILFVIVHASRDHHIHLALA